MLADGRDIHFVVEVKMPKKRQIDIGVNAKGRIRLDSCLCSEEIISTSLLFGVRILFSVLPLPCIKYLGATFTVCG